MKVRKLRGFVLPTIYLLAITTIVISIVIIGNTIKSYNATEDESEYVTNSILDDDTTPVVKEKVIKTIEPFKKEGVEVVKGFYEKDAKEEQQKNSLIYYEKTYMQNSGILYKAKEEFEVIATADGTITNIKEDDLLGIIVEIDHNPKLKTVYQSLKDVKVTVGAAVKQGDVIGTSGPNSVDKSSNFELLFEVSHNGKLINPTNFYNQDIKTFEE